MGKAKALALKNVKKTKAKPKVKKWTKKMQKSHQLEDLDVLTNVNTENINVNKWFRTFNNYLQKKLTKQKNNYFFGDDGVRKKITKIYIF